ncbi:MAG: sulfotransferase family protein [Flavobacteriales bacterium]|nr:sulfotransferase family protein [Flavobacteriales bacterium]
MRIHLISTPRNVSTALMYSFAQRRDTRVVDEPFYAYYLERSGAQHPGRTEVLSAMPIAIEEIMDQLDREDDREHLFMKGMGHHLDGVPIELLAEWTSLFFIRDPKQLIASFAQVIPDPTMRDIGSEMLVTLHSALRKAGGRTLVLDSADLVREPEGTLAALCTELGMPFDRAMLQWRAGPRPEDGIWAKYWYANVHRTNGFMAQPTSQRELPEQCRPLYEAALPYFEELRQYAIRS